MSWRLFATTVAAAALAAAPGSAQTASNAAKAAAPAKTAKGFTAPKTPWGDPDLQGLWPASSQIPMQRPANEGDKTQLTDEELAARQEAYGKQEARDKEQKVQTTGSGPVTINPPGYWVEHAIPNKQTSLVVDPPNGRIPALTPEAQARLKALRGGKGPGSHYPEVVNTWEDFDIYSRCITRGMLSSMLPTLYNFGNEIVQGKGYVVIRSEMIHESRIIPLDGGPHAGSNIKTYMGDSRGHWEGNTLVVETTNFNGKIGIGGGAPTTDALKITERFTRTAPDQLSYDATISDPGTWVRPWTIHYPYKLDPSYPIYEYACHEGNYGILNALKGAREMERQGRSTAAPAQVIRPQGGGPGPQ
jgi:hypothetical protein